jgi:glucan phosphoethanolaminetransferase (alkaline phosphatase superfamily)
MKNMIIVKKVLGYILLLSAIILSFATLFSILKLVIDSIIEFNLSLTRGVSFVTPMLLIAAALILIIFFMFKMSLKLIRFKKKIHEDSINDIGEITS